LSSPVNVSCSLRKLHPHPPAGEVADDPPKVVEITGQAIQRVHHDRVPSTHEAQHLAQLRPVDVLARQPVNERLIQRYPLELARRVLLQ